MTYETFSKISDKLIEARLQAIKSGSKEEARAIGNLEDSLASLIKLNNDNIHNRDAFGSAYKKPTE